jgi:hypothetical protein
MTNKIQYSTVTGAASRLRALGVCLGLAFGSTATTAFATHPRSNHRTTHSRVIRARRAQQQDAAFRFARCMREHGAEQPDPTQAPGRPGLTLDITDSGPNVVAARAACQPILDELTNAKAQAIGAAGIEAREQEAGRFVACVRGHGVVLGEPQAPLYEVGPLLDRADRETSKADAPKLEAAKVACWSLNPAFGG